MRAADIVILILVHVTQSAHPWSWFPSIQGKNIKISSIWPPENNSSHSAKIPSSATNRRAGGSFRGMRGSRGDKSGAKRGRGFFSDIFGISQAVPPQQSHRPNKFHEIARGKNINSGKLKTHARGATSPQREVSYKQSRLIFPTDFDDSETQFGGGGLVSLDKLFVNDPNSPYGLIDNLIDGAKLKPHPVSNSIVEMVGIAREEIWLSDGNLLVLRGGITNRENHMGSYHGTRDKGIYPGTSNFGDIKNERGIVSWISSEPSSGHEVSAVSPPQARDVSYPGKVTVVSQKDSIRKWNPIYPRTKSNLRGRHPKRFNSQILNPKVKKKPTVVKNEFKPSPRFEPLYMH